MEARLDFQPTKMEHACRASLMQSPPTACARAGPEAKARAAGPAGRLGAARPAGVERRATVPLRPRGLHAEPGRLSLRAHDRRGRGAVPLLLYEGEEERDDHPLLELLAGPARRPAPTSSRPYGFLLVAGNAYVEAVGVDGRRASCTAAARPHAGGARRRRLAGGFEYTVGGARCASTGAGAGVRRSCICRCSIPSTTITAAPARGGGRPPSTSTTRPAPGTRRCSTMPPGPRARWSTRRRAAT